MSFDWTVTCLANTGRVGYVTVIMSFSMFVICSFDNIYILDWALAQRKSVGTYNLSPPDVLLEEL